MMSPEPKLLFNVLSGGKIQGSPCKFAKFYLIVDGYACQEDSNLAEYFKNFVSNLRKSFAAQKGGDAAFKQLPDGSFFNAFTSVADSLKAITEAIKQSGAQGNVIVPTVSSSKRGGGTAETGERASTAGGNSVANGEDSGKKAIFRIGISCDADNSFNKDPKDPNKYEIEGVKGQNTAQMLSEYYIKLISEYPLITLIEDPFCETDFDGFKILKKALAENSKDI